MSTATIIFPQHEAWLAPWAEDALAFTRHKIMQERGYVPLKPGRVECTFEPGDGGTVREFVRWSYEVEVRPV